MALLTRDRRRPPAASSFARRAAGLLLLGLALAALPVAAQPRPPSEPQLKAAFIHRIAGFIEWPKQTTAPLRFCVLGGNPFGGALDAYRGRLVQNRPLEIRLAALGDSLQECHLLFVPASVDKHLERIVALAREAGILTIGDTEGHAQRGIMLNFYPDRDRLRFEINLEALRRSGLKASSKLLELARIIDGAPSN